MAANVLAVVLIGLAAHSPPVREFVRARVAERATELAGVPVSIGRLQYNLLTLVFEADDVAVAATPSAAVAAGVARSVLVDVSWRAFTGGRVELEQVHVLDLDVRASSATRALSLDVNRLSLQLSDTGQRRLVGHMSVRGPASVQIGSTASELTRVAGDLAFDGRTLDLSGVQVSAPGLDVEITGRLEDLLGETPRASINGTWQGNVPEMCAVLALPAASCGHVRGGTLQGSLTVGGALASPVVHVEGVTSGLVAGVSVSTPIAVNGKAVMSARAIEIPRLDVTAFGGTASLRGSMLIGRASRITAATLTWQGIDLGALLETLGHPAPLAVASGGRAVIMGDALVPEALTVKAHARLAPSRGTGVPAAGWIDGRLDSGLWSVRLVDSRLGDTLTHGEASGRIPRHGAVRWGAAPLAGAMRLETADVRGTLDTLRELGVPSVPRIAPGDWHAHAVADVNLEGTLGDPVMTGVVEMSGSRPHDLHRVSAYARVRVDSAGVEISSLEARRDADLLKGSGRYASRSGAIDGEFTATIPDLGGLAELANLSGWHVRGGGDIAAQIAGTVVQPQVHAVLHADDLEIARPLSGSTDAVTVALGDVAVNVTTADRVDVRMDAPDRRASISGVLALEAGWPFDVVVTFEDADVEALLGSAARASGVAGTFAGSIAVGGAIARPDDLHADIHLSRVDATVQGVTATLARPARVRMEAGRLSEVLLDARIDDLAVQLGRAHPGDPLQLSIAGGLSPARSRMPGTIAIDLDAQVGGSSIEIRRASARLGAATADATGQIPLWFLNRWLPTSSTRRSPAEGDEHGSPAVMRVELRALPLDNIVRRLLPGVVDRLEGTFDIAAVVEADRPSVSGVRIDGRIEHGWLRTGDVRVDQQDSAALALRDGVASLSGWRWTAPGLNVTLSGETALNGPAPRFQVAVAGHVDLATAVTPGTHRLGGIAHVDLSASGDRGGVSWNGQVDVRDGAWMMRQPAIALTDVETSVACVLDRCRVERFTGRLNGGTLTIEGDVPMPGAAVDSRLRATVRDAGLEMPKGTRHDLDADLDLTGSEPPRLTGSVTLWPAAVSDSITGLAALVSGRNSVPVEQPRDSVSAALSRVGVDVRIVSGDDLTFDSPDLQVTATADLRVGGTLASPQLRGQVASRDRGSVFLAGRSWDLEEGTISLLEGARGTDARVAATVSAPISKYLVRIRLSGPANRPTLVMTSDPPLGQSDLAELVLTGATSGTLTSTGQQVATLVSSELLTSVGRTIGVDAMRIEHTQSDLSTTDIEAVSRLTVSKRLTDKFEIVYSQGLSESDDLAWILVLRPGWRALDLRATVRTNGAEAYELRQEFEFGGPQSRGGTARARRPPPPPVSRIDVAGLGPEDATAVRRVLALAVGKPFTARQWQRDRETVARYFHERDRLRVRVRASHAVAADGSYALAYDIAPGPVTTLEVRGHDVGGDTVALLRDAWAQTVIEDLLAEELTGVVRLRMAARGYFGAEVTTTFNPLPDEGRLAVIDIVPGPRTRHRSIEFAGNTAIATDDLRGFVPGQSSGSRHWLEPSVLEAPIAAVYHERGYIAAKVQAMRSLADDRATLTVHVDEGRPFTVGRLTIAGSTLLGESAARAGFGLVPGAPFSNQALSGALASLRTSYLRAGYLDAEIESTETVRRDLGVVDVSLSVIEGRSSVLREIRVAGREETSAKLVARALGITAGGTVNPVALDEAQQRLYDTGIFRTVDIAVRPREGAVDAVEAVVTLEERARYRLRYGIQFGPTTIDSITTESNSAEPGATIDLQRRNLLGLGIVLGGGGVWSAEQHRIRTTVSAATFLGQVVSTTFTLENANQDRVSDDGLQIVDRGVAAVLEQRWRFGRDRRVEIAYGFNVDHRRVELRATTAESLPLRGRFAGLNTTFTYDTRDNRLNPRRGMFHSSRIEGSSGLWVSDIAFARYQVQQYTFFPAGPLTLASGFRFGSLDVDNEREPAAMLLYFKTGGGSSVRGYETDTLTPAYALGHPVGGKVLLVINEEVRVPLARRFGIVGFLDAGNTFTGLDTVTVGGLKVGVGSGVRVDTPVAVLRFDVGLPLPRPPVGRRARWYLSIGQAF